MRTFMNYSTDYSIKGGQWSVNHQQRQSFLSYRQVTGNALHTYSQHGKVGHVSVRERGTLIASPSLQERLEQLANQHQLEGLVEGMVEECAADDQLERGRVHGHHRRAVH